MELKHILTMVKQRRSERGLKYTPTYRYGTHWKSSSNANLELIKFLNNNKGVKLIRI